MFEEDYRNLLGRKVVRLGEKQSLVQIQKKLSLLWDNLLHPQSKPLISDVKGRNDLEL